MDKVKQRLFLFGGDRTLLAFKVFVLFSARYFLEQTLAHCVKAQFILAMMITSMIGSFLIKYALSIAVAFGRSA